MYHTVGRQWWAEASWSILSIFLRTSAAPRLCLCVCDVHSSTCSRFDVPLKRPHRHQTSHSETESGTQGTLRMFIIRLWCHSPNSKPSSHWIKNKKIKKQDNFRNLLVERQNGKKAWRDGWGWRKQRGRRELHLKIFKGEGDGLC